MSNWWSMGGISIKEGLSSHCNLSKARSDKMTCNCEHLILDSERRSWQRLLQQSKSSCSHCVHPWRSQSTLQSNLDNLGRSVKPLLTVARLTRLNPMILRFRRNASSHIKRRIHKSQRKRRLPWTWEDKSSFRKEFINRRSEFPKSRADRGRKSSCVLL